ncbi:exportin-6 [Anaeramoeba flamelloides]|uniref:Exportin-6 n=1 Tax=Anaeramoeba flamelloides TaxID=1746091 RepID=A0AAV7YJN3_9EUKA|nr:exportin-6 [Anaeramoeba flamelloides]
MSIEIDIETELNKLKNLLHEFYGGSINPDRKTEIGKILMVFQNSQESYKYSLLFLQHTNDNFVLYFCFSVFQIQIKTRWHLIPLNEKNEFRELLFDFLLSKFTELPQFVISKVISTTVDDAKRDWPEEFPKFFTNIEDLIDDSKTTIIGLQLLKTTLEEFVSSKTDISSKRQLQLNESLNSQITQIMKLLYNLLIWVFEHCESNENLKSNENEIFTLSLQKMGLFNIIIPEDLIEMCTLIFECLINCFSWLDLNSYLKIELIEILCKYCFVIDKYRKISSQSLSCIVQILTRKYLPTDEQFIPNIFSLIYILINSFLENEDLIERCTYIYIHYLLHSIELILSIYLTRLENNNLEIQEFLNIFFKFQTYFSFQIKGKQNKQEELDEIKGNNELFLCCVDVWKSFYDACLLTKPTCTNINSSINNNNNNSIVNKNNKLINSNNNNNKLNLVKKYSEGFLEVNSYFLSKISLICLDEESFNDHDELETFINKIKEFSIQIAFEFPNPVLSKLYELFEENYERFIQLPQSINKISTLSEEEQLIMQVTVHDLVIWIDLFGSLNEIFLSNFLDMVEPGLTFIEKIIEIISVSIQMKSYAIDDKLTKVIISSFLTLSLFTPWISKLTEIALSKNYSIINRDHIITFFEKTISIILSTFNTEVPKQLLESSIIFLNKLSINSRSAELIGQEPIQELIQNCFTITVDFDIANQTLIYVSLTNLLLLPLNNLPEIDQCWEERSLQFTKLINPILESFNTIKFDIKFISKEKNNILRIFSIFTGIIDSLKKANKKSRSIFFEIVTIELFNATFEILSNQILDFDISLAIVKLFDVSLQVLLFKFESQYIIEKINTILLYFESFPVLQNVEQLSQDSTIISLLCKVLKMLTELLNRTRRSDYQKLTPSVTQFIISQYSNMSNNFEFLPISLQLEIYTLVYTLILEKWNYFNSQNNQFTIQVSNQSLLPNEQFSILLNILINSFEISKEIKIIKENLLYFQSLNKIRKIFTSQLLTFEIIFQLLSAFINLMVQKTHVLLHDDIIQIVFTISQIDFESILPNFIPKFLENYNHLFQEQKKLLLQNFSFFNDLPSFRNQLKTFVNDFAYFLTINKTNEF